MLCEFLYIVIFMLVSILAVLVAFNMPVEDELYKKKKPMLTDEQIDFISQPFIQQRIRGGYNILSKILLELLKG